MLGLGLSQFDLGGLASRMQNLVFDTYQHIQPRVPKGQSHTVYIDIGAESTHTHGAWPWPRKRLIDLVEAVQRGGPKAILLDMPLDESDPTSNSELLHLFSPSVPGMEAAIAQLPDRERQFASLLGTTPSIISFTPGKHQNKGEIRLPSLRAGLASQGAEARKFASNFSEWRASLPPFEETAKGNGATLPNRVPGTTVRALPMVITLNHTLYPSNALEAVRIAHGGSNYLVSAREAPSGFAFGFEPGIEKIHIGGTNLGLSTGTDGTLRLYFGAKETRHTISASTLLNGTANLTELAGKIAVIGVSANGSDRFYQTPIGVSMPSGAIVANAIDQVVDNAFLLRPDWAPSAEQLFIFIGGLLVILLVIRTRAIFGLVLASLLTVGAFYGSWWAFDTHRWLVDPTLGSLTLLVATFTCALLNRVNAGEQTRFIDVQFARRLSSSALAKVHAHPKLIQAEGELRPVTSVVVGLRGFNVISDRYLEDPKAYADILNRFFSPMSNIVMDRNGMVDRTVGDTLYAVWNAPFDVSDHASKGCDAALRMVENLEALNEFLEEDALRQHLSHVPLSLSIGIDSGIGITGNMGAILRFDYGVLGEPVTFAAYLQKNARFYGPAIIVGEGTQMAVGNRYALLEIDLISTPRHPEGRRVYALLGDPIMRANPKFRALQEAHEAIFATYRKQRWAEARAAIAETRKLNGAIPTLYDFYEERIAHYEANPPGEHWNGAWFAGRI